MRNREYGKGRRRNFTNRSRKSLQSDSYRREGYRHADHVIIKIISLLPTYVERFASSSGAIIIEDEKAVVGAFFSNWILSQK